MWYINGLWIFIMWFLESLLMFYIKLRLEMMLKVRGASSPGHLFTRSETLVSWYFLLCWEAHLGSTSASMIPHCFPLFQDFSSPFWMPNELTTSSLGHLIMICCLSLRSLSHAFPSILYCKLFKGREYSLYLCIPQLATECRTHNYPI